MESFLLTTACHHPPSPTPAPPSQCPRRGASNAPFSPPPPPQIRWFHKKGNLL
jgi:hypothetical protein